MRWRGRNAPLPESWFAGERSAARFIMVDRQLYRRGIRDRRVLEAMARTPRHRFVAAGLADLAYADHPLAIGHAQTISQPYIVAKTLELAGIERGMKVLEVGSGCGYQTAVLLAMGAHVVGLEIVRELAEEGRRRLAGLGYSNFEIQCADAFDGWPEGAPYNAIVMAAAPEKIPAPLPGQLVDGGRLVGPEGLAEEQSLIRIVRRGNDFNRERIKAVRFVPMTGRATEE